VFPDPSPNPRETRLAASSSNPELGISTAPGSAEGDEEGEAGARQQDAASTFWDVWLQGEGGCMERHEEV